MLSVGIHLLSLGQSICAQTFEYDWASSKILWELLNKLIKDYSGIKLRCLIFTGRVPNSLGEGEGGDGQLVSQGPLPGQSAFHGSLTSATNGVA